MTEVDLSAFCSKILQKFSVDSEELQFLLGARSQKHIDFALIDIREKYEHQHHFIDGTDFVIHNSSFYAKIKSLKDKNALYILYCSDGSRSRINADTMRQIGYKSVLNLEKGINAFNGKIIWKYSSDEA